MTIKIIFIGNTLGGDDGIGPFLYTHLKDEPKLKLDGIEMMELGVIGLDMLSYIDDGDKIIIVDAVREKKEHEIGKVRLLSESDLKEDLKLVSQHDFGVEETTAILRMYKPKLEKINLIGINVRNINAFDDNLSDEIKTKIPKIKNDVINYILQISNEI